METWGGNPLGPVNVMVDMGLLRLVPLLLRAQVFADSALQFDLCGWGELE